MGAYDAFSKATVKFLKELKDLEGSVVQMERDRKGLVVELREAVEADGTVDDPRVHQLHAMIAARQELAEHLSRLDAALANSQATFARLEAKASKDQALLADVEALRKRRGRGPMFDVKHPLVRKHRNAVEDLIQKLGFLDDSIKKLGDMLDLKISYNGGLEELVALNGEVRRLRNEYEEWLGGKSKVAGMAKYFETSLYALDPDRL